MILRRMVVYSLLVTGFLMMLSSMICYRWLRSAGPRQPDSITGHVYPMRMQQPFDVYLTRFQTKWINCGPFIGVAIVFAGACLNTHSNVIPDRRNQLPKKLY
jgi:hypothetical protein